MKSTSLLLIFILLLLTTAACEKDGVDALPDATQDGKNKMGCLVNGKAWKPYEAPQLGGGNPFTVYWRVGNGQTSLYMAFEREADNSSSYISFYVPSISNSGAFALDQPANPILVSANPAYGRYIDTGATPDITYLTGPTATGQLTITRFDTTARIVSGTFDFTGRAADGGTVEVSKGRFDMRMERR